METTSFSLSGELRRFVAIKRLLSIENALATFLDYVQLRRYADVGLKRAANIDRAIDYVEHTRQGNVAVSRADEEWFAEFDRDAALRPALEKFIGSLGVVSVD